MTGVISRPGSPCIMAAPAPTPHASTGRENLVQARGARNRALLSRIARRPLLRRGYRRPPHRAHARRARLGPRARPAVAAQEDLGERARPRGLRREVALPPDEDGAGLRPVRLAPRRPLSRRDSRRARLVLVEDVERRRDEPRRHPAGHVPRDLRLERVSLLESAGLS